MHLGRGGWSWVVFECARIPQLLLVSGFVFAPYFANVVVGDAVRGQSLIGAVTASAGLMVAVLAPLIGATVDKSGPRKPLLAACVFCLTPLLFSLWWARADGAGLPILAILTIMTLIGVLGGIIDLLFNSLLPVSVGRRGAAKASGYALALANIVGVLALVIVLWCFELPGKMHLAGLSDSPLFGLDQATYEPRRIVGPIAGMLWVIFCLPLFLYASDGLRTGLSLSAAAKSGVKDLVALVKNARTVHRNLALFLLARVAFFDAIGASIAFNGVYTSGVMGWKGPEMLLSGILIAVFCGIGALVGQALDRTIGPRRALLVELAGLLVFILGQIGMSTSRVLFVPYDTKTHGAVWASPIFAHLPDLVFLGLALGAAVTMIGAFSSARTLLVRLTPVDQVGSVFGLAALTGSATNWLAPLFISIFTARWGSQQAGFVPLLILLGLGLLTMCFVRGGDVVSGVDN
ncbi:hypothetical protein UP10_36720 [Bradyrhizobium sp. LTSPM299]|nr:hypothetical protein UP10_36720 [Bradyrhizobium sp. LTSPM299]